MKKFTALLLTALSLLLCACAAEKPAQTTAPDTTPKKEMVSVTFQPNNGDGATVLEVEKGKLVENPPVPQKRACKFAGWYLDGNTPWDPAAMPVDKTTTLTAKWTLAENAFEKDPNAGNRAEGTQLRVCSFNTLLPTVGKKVPVAGRDTGLRNMVNEYQPDVIAFQEFNEDWAKAFQTLFADTAYRLISGDEVTVKGKTVGNTLAYNSAVLTLVEYGSFPYAISDSTVSRVLTWAVFETKDGKRFIATSTHWALTEEQRVEEAKELAKWIVDTTAEKKLPIIAMGDYNARDGAIDYLQLLKKSGMKDAKYTAAKRGLVGLTHHSRKQSSYNDEKVNLIASIDHILHTENIQPLYYDTVLNSEIVTASDHCPIYADIQFKS